MTLGKSFGGRPKGLRPIPFLPWRQVVFIGLTTLVVQIAAAVIVSRLFGSIRMPMNERPSEYWAAIMLLPAAAAIVWLWFTAVWRERDGWAGLGFHALTAKQIGVAMVIGLGAVLIHSFTAKLLAPILGLPAQYKFGGATGFSDVNPVLALLVFAGVAGLAPMFEELLFRGVLFGRLRQHLPLLAAAFLAAVPHALIHMQLATLPGLIIVFLIFGILYERMASLWAPVIAHCVHNGVILAVAYQQIH